MASLQLRCSLCSLPKEAQRNIAFLWLHSRFVTLKGARYNVSNPAETQVFPSSRLFFCYAFRREQGLLVDENLRFSEVPSALFYVALSCTFLHFWTAAEKDDSLRSSCAAPLLGTHKSVVSCSATVIFRHALLWRLECPISTLFNMVYSIAALSCLDTLGCRRRFKAAAWAALSCSRSLPAGSGGSCR